MPGKYLADTNIVIRMLAEEPSIRERLDAGLRLWVPVIVLGELYYGARKSQRVAENVARVEQLVSSVSILDCDLATAREYGVLKAALRRKGRPIPDNDLWLAALARQHSLVVVTRDRHFDEIEGLVSEEW